MQETERDPQRATRPPSAAGPSSAPAAFEEVYLQFAPRLRKIAVRKFRIPSIDVETLVHDVFATYFMHAASVNAVEPYLVGAICNASRHYWRKSDADDALFCEEVPCMATPSAAVLEEVDRKLLLSRIIGNVGARCRDLFQRYYWNGETTKAIAAALDSTPGTILVFLHKCRRRALAKYRSDRGRG